MMLHGSANYDQTNGSATYDQTDVRRSPLTNYVKDVVRWILYKFNVGKTKRHVWDPSPPPQRRTPDCCRSPLFSLVVSGLLFSITVILAYTLCHLWIEIGILDEIDFGHEPYVPPKIPMPKIIHQTWLGYTSEQPPQEYRNLAAMIRLSNPHYEYRLWGATDVEQLLREDYPWFIDNYQRYPYFIQKTDAIRYLIMHKYGGVYVDMDDLLRAPLDEIIAQNQLDRCSCTFPGSRPSGLINHLILCEPQAPFMDYIIRQLADYNNNYGPSYSTVQWSTGGRFLTGRLRELSEKDRMAICHIPPDRLDMYLQLPGPKKGGAWMGRIAQIFNIFNFTYHNKYVFCCTLLFFVLFFLVLAIKFTKTALRCRNPILKRIT